MGSRLVVSIGIVLLIAGGKIWAAAEKHFNISANETVNQTWPAGAGPQPRPRLSYRLKIYQLQRTATETEEAQQAPKDPESSHGAGESSKRLRVEEPVHRLLSIPGPDLNPPLGPETRVTVITDHRVPVPAASVAAHCGEEDLFVAVEQNFFGNGQLIHPSDLTLGDCVAQQTSNHILAFQTALQDCNSVLKMTEDTLVYFFSLVYSPTPIGNTVILKTNPAEVLIECHYQRRHFASSNALRPNWIPFAAMMHAEKQLHFSLHLMSEDWQSPRQFNIVFLSEMMHIEAAVLRGYHVPLRIYVDSCAATATPDPDSQPRYSLIENHGCLSDSKWSGANSFFLQRSEEDKLQFQLKAFRFNRDKLGNNSIHITCHLKAMTLSVPIDWQHKACSFLTEASRWVASDGDNMVCRCCESSCSEKKRQKRLAADDGFPPRAQWEARASQSVTLLEESSPEPPQEPAPQSSTASSSSMDLLCGTGTIVVLVLLAFVGAVVCNRISQPTDYTVCT